jgi:starch synthase
VRGCPRRSQPIDGSFRIRPEVTRSGSRILVAHPSKHAYAYEVAVTLQERRQLLRFVTGIYDVPDCWLRRATNLASGIGGRDRFERLWSKRRHAAIDPANVTTLPMSELLSRSVGRWRVIQRLTARRSGYLFVNWSFDRAVARALLAGRFRPDAVYAFVGAARHTFAAARRLGIRTILDVPIVLSAIGTMVEECRILDLPVEQRSISQNHLELELQTADWIIAPSAAVVDSIRAIGYRSGVSEVPFGANLDVFRPGTEKNGHFRVVYAGRVEMRKGVHHLVQAWREAGIPGELLLAGSVDESEFVHRLRRQYTDSVRELGNLTESELANVFAAADVFAMPSLAEGSAVVTYEALAAGLPCVVTHETGSVVRDGREGFIVPTRSPAVLAARLRQLYEDRASLHRMAVAARARAEEFSWATYHDRLFAAIESALASTRAIHSATV